MSSVCWPGGALALDWSTAIISTPHRSATYALEASNISQPRRGHRHSRNLCADGRVIILHRAIESITHKRPVPINVPRSHPRLYSYFWLRNAHQARKPPRLRNFEFARRLNAVQLGLHTRGASSRHCNTPFLKMQDRAFQTSKESLRSSVSQNARFDATKPCSELVHQG